MKKDFILRAAIFLFIVILIMLFIQIKSDGTKCMANPSNYFIETANKQTGQDLTCNCYFNSSKYASFILGKNGTTFDIPNYDRAIEFNFSAFKLAD